MHFVEKRLFNFNNQKCYARKVIGYLYTVILLTLLNHSKQINLYLYKALSKIFNSQICITNKVREGLIVDKL